MVWIGERERRGSKRNRYIYRDMDKQGERERREYREKERKGENEREKKTIIEQISSYGKDEEKSK